jgi:predicted Zn-dependent protease
MHHHRKSLVPFLAGFVMLGCLTPAAEQELGATEEARLEETVGLSDHARSAAWVTAVGRRVAQHAPPGVDYRFHVIDMEAPNAFALPGGPVYISRGLLALLNSEDELAGVLGHEIGHIVGRHATRRKAAATPLAILIGVPAGIVSSIAPRLGRLASLPAAVAGSVAISAYSRQQEYAADEFGVDYAAAAGYDPGALADALRALEREHALHGDGPTRSSFLASHPSTPDRRQRVRNRAKNRVPGPAAPVASSRAAVLERLSGLMAGPNPRNGSFAGDRFLHLGLEFSIRMPADWQHVNTPEAVASMPSADRRDVFVTLQLAGAGDDPMELLDKSDLDDATRSRIQRRKISGLPATQLTMEAEGKSLDFTWVSYGGRIYAITGVAPAKEAKRYASVFKGVADSFAPLRATDRAKIQVLRVAIVEARSGESLMKLAGRSGAAWGADWISAANAIAPTDRLSQGQGVKVVVERRYGSRP